MSTIPGWYSVNEAGEYLGLSGSTVRQYCNRALLRGRKFGQAWLLEQRELDRYLKERRPPGNPNLKKSQN